MTMGLIILKMAQTEIMRLITQMMMMVLTHILYHHLVTMNNPQDPMIQQKKNTQHTSQESEYTSNYVCCLIRLS